MTTILIETDLDVVSKQRQLVEEACLTLKENKWQQ